MDALSNTTSNLAANRGPNKTRVVLGTLNTNGVPSLGKAPGNEELKKLGKVKFSEKNSVRSPRSVTTASTQTTLAGPSVSVVYDMTCIDYKKLTQKRKRNSEELAAETEAMYDEVANLSELNDTLNETIEEYAEELEELQERRNSLSLLVKEANHIIATAEKESQT